MRRHSITAWLQFENMMRTGVPHTLEIASELVKYNLKTPISSSASEVDLQFYGVIHRAYRTGVLPTFLGLMELIKRSDLGERVRNSEKTQLWLLQNCSSLRTMPFCQVETLTVDFCEKWRKLTILQPER